MLNERDILAKAPKPVVILLACIFVLFFGLIDYLNGPAASLSIFYLIPVAYVSWFVGSPAGVCISILSAVAWSVDDIFSAALASHRYIPYWNVVMQLCFLVFVVYVMTSLKKALIRERDFAREDFLTKVANGRFFYEIASAEMARARRYRHALSFAYLDIDNFKAVNDRMGHSVGDHLLSDIAMTMKRSVRAVDVVARMGGDEFAILMPETDEAGARSVVSRLSKSISDAAKITGWPITVSMGVIVCMDQACTLDSIIKKADSLMYSVKNSGKDSFKFEILKSDS